jgi:hypothetical protein
MPHLPSNFTKFAGTDFEQYNLPIIPPGAKLTENSSLNPEQLGKIPGEWLPEVGAWRGFANWQNQWAWPSKKALERWQRWQAEYAGVMGYQPYRDRGRNEHARLLTASTSTVMTRRSPTRSRR